MNTIERLSFAIASIPIPTSSICYRECCRTPRPLCCFQNMNVVLHWQRSRNKSKTHVFIAGNYCSFVFCCHSFQPSRALSRRYLRKTQAHVIEMFTTVPPDDPELKALQESLAFDLTANEFELISIEEPHRGGLLSWSVAAPFDSHMNCALRGVLRITRQGGSCRIVCEAARCRQSSNCPHAEVARDLTSVYQDGSGRGLLLPDDDTRFDALWPPTATPPASAAAFLYRRRTWENASSSIHQCVCHQFDENCKCRPRCQCSGFLLEETVRCSFQGYLPQD